ncbi:unnamed protein product [Phaeothamnion confervicola]
MAVVEDDDVGDRPLLESRINGVLPVVLCAGHGGDDTLQETRLAERPAGEPGVKTLADVGTAQLLEELERRIATKTGANCSIVIAKFHRRFIDVNRDASMPKEHAVACAEGRRLHEAYHAAVDAAVGRLMTANRFGRVLILDLHGQAAHPSQIFIGTRDGATADLNRLETPGEGLLWHLRRRLASVTAPPRMAAMMAAAGTAAAESIAQAAAQAAAVAAVAPPAPGTATAAVAATAEFPVPETEPSLLLPEPGRPELENYKGGYTVHRHCGVGVDAVQLEIGSDWRRRHGARAEMAEVLADAVHHYLQRPETSPARPGRRKGCGGRCTSWESRRRGTWHGRCGGGFWSRSSSWPGRRRSGRRWQRRCWRCAGATASKKRRRKGGEGVKNWWQRQLRRLKRRWQTGPARLASRVLSSQAMEAVSLVQLASEQSGSGGTSASFSRRSVYQLCQFGHIVVYLLLSTGRFAAWFGALPGGYGVQHRGGCAR